VLRNRLLPHWGNRVALSVEPLEVEEWLKALKRKEGLANQTLDKMRRVMSLVYRHSQQREYFCGLGNSQRRRTL
jgi:hypothetical protein